ncbi:hypothetical protein BOX15_Mlig027086g1 [Macrostomum lignano]|uniref:Uncharacterized protein n=1 Tax=Macrostomum lignano TaxID=282301 RepID=A0A267EKW8_9PLAT|nr:hypothetical protein BOX15_Mlig027086g2 [Macrostomum lignano]PAA61624.1 hypothetical protein BOX15_Mlig027086g1 [Macrostomum lignano]
MRLTGLLALLSVLGTALSAAQQLDEQQLRQQKPMPDAELLTDLIEKRGVELAGDMYCCVNGIPGCCRRRRRRSAPGADEAQEKLRAACSCCRRRSALSSPSPCCLACRQLAHQLG